MRTTAELIDEAMAGIPHVAQTLHDAHDAAWAGVDRTLLELCRLRTATLLGNTEENDTFLEPSLVAALPDWPTSPLFTETHRSCLAFTEEFVIDVASLSDATAAAAVASLGIDGFLEFANALLVVEQRQRMRLALTTLFPERAP